MPIQSTEAPLGGTAIVHQRKFGLVIPLLLEHVRQVGAVF